MSRVDDGTGYLGEMQDFLRKCNIFWGKRSRGKKKMQHI